MIRLLKSVGRVVRTHRMARDESQEDLAAATRLHRTYIGALERGETNISLANLQRVALALEVRVSDLLADAERAAFGPRGRALSPADGVPLRLLDGRPAPRSRATRRRAARRR